MNIQSLLRQQVTSNNRQQATATITLTSSRKQNKTKMFLTKCWAPCFTLRQSNLISLEKGCTLIACYTAFLHFFSLTYAIAILSDQVRTDVFYSPLFEFSKSTSRTLAMVIIVYSVLYIICCSFSLIYGILSVSTIFTAFK